MYRARRGGEWVQTPDVGLAVAEICVGSCHLTRQNEHERTARRAHEHLRKGIFYGIGIQQGLKFAGECVDVALNGERQRRSQRSFVHACAGRAGSGVDVVEGVTGKGSLDADALYVTTIDDLGKAGYRDAIAK